MVDDINDIFDPEAIYPAGGKPERKKGPKTVFEMSKAEQREYFKQKIEDQRTKRFINNLSAKDHYVKRLEDQLVHLKTFVAHNKLEPQVKEFEKQLEKLNEKKNKKT